MHHVIYPAHLNFDGQITLIPQEHVIAYCGSPEGKKESGEITCTLRYGSWTQHAGLLHLNNTASSIDTSEYKEGNEWHLIKTKVEVQIKTYECCPDEYVAVDYHITFKHKHSIC